MDELSQCWEKFESTARRRLVKELVPSANLQAFAVRELGEPCRGSTRLDEWFLDVHMAARLERLFREARMSLRRCAHMYDLNGLGAQEILQGRKTDRPGLYTPDFFQCRGIRIDDGADGRIAYPRDSPCVLSGHLSGAEDSNAQRPGLRGHMRLTCFIGFDSGRG